MDKLKKQIKLRYGVKIFKNTHQQKINTWLKTINNDLIDFSTDEIISLGDHSILFYCSFIGYNEKVKEDD